MGADDGWAELGGLKVGQVFVQARDRTRGFYWDEAEQRWRTTEALQMIRWKLAKDGERLTTDELLDKLRAVLER